MHVTKSALAAAVRHVGLSCADNVKRDADWIAALLLESVDSAVKCGEADCATCYPAREPEPCEVTLADIAGSHADTELALMAAILHGMEQLDEDARQRVRQWVDERFVPRRGNPF